MRRENLEEKKVLGIIAIIFGGFGMLLSWIPIINNFAFILGLIGLILGVIAFVVNRKNKKILTVIGISLSIATIIIVIATQAIFVKSWDNATKSFSNSTSLSNNKNSKSSSSKKQSTSKIINTPISIDNGNYELTVTSYKVIPFGQPGNTYGDKPVIAFWYNVKNIKDDNLDPTSAWISLGGAKVIQDNNSSQVNTLNVASLPDENFLTTQTQKIKIGGTAQNAVAYTLTDETTPVTVSFAKSVISNDDIIAKETFNIK